MNGWYSPGVVGSPTDTPSMPRVVPERLVGQPDVLVGVPQRRGQQQRVRRRAEAEVQPVHLVARGAVIDHQRRDVADALVVADALEDERRARIVAVRLANVWRPLVEARRAAADAHQRLRRTTAVAPGAAQLAGGGQHALRRRMLEGPARAPAPHLHHVRSVRVDGAGPAPERGRDDAVEGRTPRTGSRRPDRPSRARGPRRSRRPAARPPAHPPASPGTAPRSPAPG